ncbi:MAG: glycosyltransferase [Pseudomonadota bacterium]
MGSQKIALFMQDLAGGGAERVMLQLANGIAENGHQVDLVLVRPDGPYLSMVSSKIRIVDLGTERTVKSIWALSRYIRRERPVALLSALVHVNVAAILAHLLSGRVTKLVLSEHNQISKNAAVAESRTIRLAHRLVPYLYPFADEIVAVSQGVADDLQRFSGLPSAKIKVIFNPIVTPELSSRANEPVSHPWFEPDQPPVILGVGRLNQQKDFPMLIEAFAKVRSKMPVRLIILGEGEGRAELEKLIETYSLQEDVDLPGFVDNPFAMMAKAKVFALSSAWEGLPTVLVEALACGVPVVSTNCPSGPDEILRGGELGPLVEVGNASGFAEALTAILQEPPSTQTLQARASDFTVDRSVNCYQDLLLA